MRILNVDVEISGRQVPVGKIRCQEEDKSVSFSYDEEYLDFLGAAAISISLPLQAEPFSDTATRNFFEGLLPEGFTRKSVAKWMQIDEADYISMLIGLGQECLGAVRITDESCGRIPAAYERLTSERVAELAREGARVTAQMVTKAHLSLTGASGKVGLYYRPEEDAWYLPVGEAPSTHIVKQSHVRLSGIVANERLCLLTAQNVGIEVPENFIINTGDGRDGEILFATQRYDRSFEGSESSLNGLRVPFRLHQEDFAQALGIASADKYEPKSGGYLKKAFQLLQDYSASPMEDQMKLWDVIVFDYLIGNTDNHIKNLSLLYSSSLGRIRLAPAYDILSTVIYENSTRKMAMSIGGRTALDEIERECFAKEAQEAGLNPKMAMKHFERMNDRFEAALFEAARELKEEGFRTSQDLRERILKAGGYRKGDHYGNTGNAG